MRKLVVLLVIALVASFGLPSGMPRAVRAVEDYGYPFVGGTCAVYYLDLGIWTTMGFPIGSGAKGTASSDWNDWTNGALYTENTSGVDLGKVYPDNGGFTCIKTHWASSSDKPLTGANWRTYWCPSVRGWPMPCAGTWKHFLVKMESAPLTTGSLQFSLYKNDVTTSLGFTVTSSSALNQSDLTNEVHVNPGDEVMFVAIGQGGGWPEKSVTLQFSALFVPDVLGEIPFFSETWCNWESGSRNKIWSCLDGTFTLYEGFPGATEGQAKTLIPVDGVFKRLRAVVRGDYGGYGAPGGTSTVTLRVNAENTSLAASVSGPGWWLDTSDLVNEVSVNAGDLVNWQCDTTGSYTSDYMNVTVCFVPDDPRAFFLAKQYTKSPLPTVSGTVYYSPITEWTVSTGTWGETEYPSLGIEKCIAKGLTVQISVAPGVGKARTFTLMKNGIATAIVVTISGTDNIGTVAADVAISDFDDLSIAAVCTEGAASAVATFALLGELLAPPYNLTITGQTTTSISLEWTKGMGATETMVRRKTSAFTGDYTAVTEGTYVYEGTDNFCTATGLDPGTMYYFRAWSWAD